jgi:hypothetical protein
MDDIKMEKPRLSVTLGGELKRGWDDTSRLNQRLESFAILKQRTQEFITWAVDAEITRESKPAIKTFRALNTCGDYLIFRNYLTSQRSRLIGACSCKQHLLCAFCASRRGVKHSIAYKEKVEQLKAESGETLDLVFITFTVKNGESLYETFTHLKYSMQRLLKQRTNQMSRSCSDKTEMVKLNAGVFAYEFKRGSNLNLWHPHIHMLALLPKHEKIDIQKLKNEWLKLTDNSSVINIEYCKTDDPYLEVFAYALKFSEMSHSDRWFAYKTLKSERLISSFGDLRGLQLPESETDDYLDSDEPFVDVLFKWCSLRGYNQKITLQS